MKPFERQSYRVGPFHLTELTGDKGAFIDYNFVEAHEQERHPNIILFMRGVFVRYRQDDPSEFLDFVEGDTNDKIGYRRNGVYRLQALEDKTLHYCICAKNRTRPLHKRISLKADEDLALSKDEIAVVISGAVSVKERQFTSAKIIHAATGDALLKAGPEGAVLEVFTSR